MQIIRIPMSPFEASTKSPGHMTEAGPPQGPGIWYLTFYQNQLLIYQAIFVSQGSDSFLSSPPWRI